MTTEEKLQNFYTHSLDCASKEAERLITDHQKALDQLFDEHKEIKLRQAEEEVTAETEKAKRDINKSLSADQLQIKRQLSRKNMELKEQLFAEVREKLNAYKKDPSYEDYLARKIREALDFAGSDTLKLYLDPSDESHKASLEKKLSVTLTISSMPFLGGIRAVIPDKNILIDNSFDTLIAEERENFIFHGGIGNE
ncbi:MAG: V-type ATP synthase subunit E [Fusicatenibacter sp.]|nr:V-type ATP synthase subunit E [Fusicatenibacter sp.]